MFFSYVKSLGKTIPRMFALNHNHYARWMTFRVRGLLALENNCPTTHAQVHKQLNAMVKGNGYVIMGITKTKQHSGTGW